MREIKFRAWHIQTKCWHYFQIPRDIFTSWFLDGGGLPSASDYENWCEYTGRKDNNGKEIYGGYICKAHHPDEYGYFVGYIIWDNELSLYSLRTEICSDIKLYELDDIESIGNIYENPELVNGNSDSKSEA